MSTLDEVKQLISSHVELITVNAKGIAEAKERSGKFLIATSILTTYLKDLEEKLAKLKTLEEAQYARAGQQAEGKNVTEKKMNIALNKSYTDIREAYEKAQAQKDWVKTHVKIFENAHIMYRAYSREV